MQDVDIADVAQEGVGVGTEVIAGVDGLCLKRWRALQNDLKCERELDEG